MAMILCTSAMMSCSFGTAPSTLNVLPDKMILASNKPMANIMDNKPIVNIPPFAMCNSVINPATKRPPPVIFTPAPCVPNITLPWTPGNPTVLVKNLPSIDNNSKLMCMWGGVISVTFPGQVTVMV
ncbi:MAG: DUF4280 domain-containing protein [Campylobacterales bacterium]|nr:DUF4280 domain-containing protein [Campylobacterales bacterium]